MSRTRAPKGVTGSASSVVLAGSPGLRPDDQTIAFLTLTSGPTIGASLPDGVEVLLDASIAPDAIRRVYVLRYVPPEGVDPGANVTIPFTGSSNFILDHTRLRDADPVTPVDVVLTEAGSRNTASSGSTLTAPGFDPTVVGVRGLYFYAKLAPGSGITISPPDGLQTLARTVGNGSVGQASRLCTELLDSDAAIGPRTATSSDSSNRWVAVSVAVRPKTVPPVLWWEGDAETQAFDDFADTSAATGGIDYLSPQVRDIISAPAGMDGYAYRFTVNGVASNNTQRCESRALLGEFDEGDEAWLAGRTYLPAGFPVSPGEFQLIMQLKNDGSGSPPLALHVEQGEYQLQGGYGHPTEPRPMTARDLGDAVPGQVDEWLWHVLFSSDPAVGQVSIWRNGQLVVDALKPPGGTKYPGQPDYLKIGIYRGAGLATDGAAVVHDGWRVGPTRQAVQLSLPPLPARPSPFLAYFPDRQVVIR